MTWLGERRGLDLRDWDALWRWSVEDLEGFWGAVWEYFGVTAHTPYLRVLAERTMPGARWFPGATLNYAEHTLGAARGRGPGRDHRVLADPGDPSS